VATGLAMMAADSPAARSFMTHYHRQYQRHRLRERSVGLLVFFFLAAFMIFAGTILAYYFIPHPDVLFFASDEDQRPRNRLVQISFAGEQFYVPTSILKRVKRRVFGSVEQVDVQIPWPYDHLAVISGTVQQTSDIRDWLLVTFVPKTDRRPPDERFAVIDKYYFAGPPIQHASGLWRYDYKADSPYKDLQLFVDRSQPDRPAVIRCDLQASSLGPMLCEREMPATGLITARIRFARTHLEHWRDIERVAGNVIRALLRRTIVE
jgi:hypothetical protein